MKFTLDEFRIKFESAGLQMQQKSPDLLDATSIESDTKLKTGHSRRRNLLLLMPVPEEDTGAGSDEAGETTRRSQKTKRCKSPLRKVRVSLPINKDELGKITQEFYDEEKIKKYIKDLGPNVRILPLKTTRNILRSIHESQTPEEEDDEQLNDKVALLNAVREQLKSKNYESLNKKSQKRSNKNDVKYVCYCEEEKSNPLEARLGSSRTNNFKQENPPRRDKVVKNNNPKKLIPYEEPLRRPIYLNNPNHRYIPRHYPLPYPRIHNDPYNYPHNYKPGRDGPTLQQSRKNIQDFPYLRHFYHLPPELAMIPDDVDDEEEPVKINIPFNADNDPSKYFTGIHSPGDKEFDDDPLSSNDEENGVVGAPQVNENVANEENNVVGAAQEEEEDDDGLRTSILYSNDFETTTEVPSWAIKNTRPFGETSKDIEECIRLYGKEFCVISGTSSGPVDLKDDAEEDNYRVHSVRHSKEDEDEDEEEVVHEDPNYVSHDAPVYYNPDENDHLISTNEQYENPLINQHGITSMEDDEEENKGEEVDEDHNGYEISQDAPVYVDNKDSTNQVPVLLHKSNEEDIIGKPITDLGSHLPDTSEVMENKPFDSSDIKEVTNAYFTSKAYDNETNQRNPYLLNSGPSSFDEFYITSPGPAEVDKEVEDDVKIGDPLLPEENESEVIMNGNEDEVNRQNDVPRVEDDEEINREVDGEVDEEVEEEDEESMPGKETDVSAQDSNLEHHISGKGEAKEIEDIFRNGDVNQDEDGGTSSEDASQDEVGDEEISENDDSPVLGSGFPSSDVDDDDEDSINEPILDNINVDDTGTINDDLGSQFITEDQEVDDEDEDLGNCEPVEDERPAPNSSNEDEDFVGNPEEVVDSNEVINEEPENESNYETQTDSSSESSMKSDPNLSPPQNLTPLETDKTAEIDQAIKEKLPFCDNTLLQNTIKAVINNFAKSNSLPADQKLDSDIVGDTGQSLLPEIQNIPNLGGVLSVPQIEHTIMQKVKDTLSKITGVSPDVMRNNWATDAIRNSLQHMTAAVPVPEERLPPMTVKERQFTNGKWSTNLITLSPDPEEPEAEEPRTTGGDLNNYISNILRHPNVGLQAARHPAVQNMVVQSVRHNYQPKNDESFDDSMAEGVFGNVVGEMEQGTSNDYSNDGENDEANLGIVREVEDNDGGSSIKPTTDDETNNNYNTFSEESILSATNADVTQVEHERVTEYVNDKFDETSRNTEEYYEQHTDIPILGTTLESSTLEEEEEEEDEDIVGSIKGDKLDKDPRNAGKFKNPYQKAVSLGNKLKDGKMSVPPEITSVLGANKDPILKNTSKTLDINKASKTNSYVTSTVRNTNKQTSSSAMESGTRSIDPEVTSPKQVEEALVGSPLKNSKPEPNPRNQGTLSTRDKNNISTTHRYSKIHEITTEVQRKITKKTKYYQHTKNDDDDVDNEDFTTSFNSDENQFTSTEAILGAARGETGSRGSSEDTSPESDYTYLGKISKENGKNNRKDLVGSDLFYIGDGVKLPLEIRRLKDGTFALSLSRKVCEHILNRECPCCVPLKGNVVRSPRKNTNYDKKEIKGSDEVINAQRKKLRTNSRQIKRTSRKQRSSSNEFNEFEESDSFEKVVESISMPVEKFAEKYNLTLNLETVQTPWNMEAKLSDKINCESGTNCNSNSLKNLLSVHDIPDVEDSKLKSRENNPIFNRMKFVKDKQNSQLYRYQRNVNDTTRKRVEILESMLIWLKGLMLGVNNAVSKSR